MDVKHFYRFAYQLPHSNGRGAAIHNLRDGDAFIEVSTVLYGRGMLNKGTLLNLPGRNLRDSSKRLVETLGPGDMIVITTRPPLSDNPQQLRRALLPGDTLLEKLIHKALRRYFLVCERSRIRLAPRLARTLPAPAADRADICFFQYCRPPRLSNAEIATLRAYGERKRHAPAKVGRTALYLVRTQAWENGPWLLCTFGIGGSESLLWAHLLRTRHARYLQEDGPLFVLGELHLEPLPKRPFTLDFADEWELEILLELRS